MSPTQNPSQQALPGAIVPVSTPIVSASSLAAMATRDTRIDQLSTDPKRIEEILSRMDDYNRSRMEYGCALRELETRLQILNDEFGHKMENNPIESIETRIKTTHSIIKKMRRRELPISVRSMEEKIFDIAGIRVICSFVPDVYSLADSLRAQEDLRILQVKDYIHSPKPNGYRSYHMIVEVPFYLQEHKTSKRVELQFRTIAMDFWASLEHKLRYKKDPVDSEQIHDRLRRCAEINAQLDQEMQEIREMMRSMK